MSILLSISASMFIRENDLKFSFFVESLCGLDMSLGRKGYSPDVPFRAEHSYSLQLDQL